MRERKIKIKRMEVPRHALLWMVIAAVWLFVIIKLVTGALFEKNKSLVSAFSVTNPLLMEATVEVTARFPEEYLDSFDKKQMLFKIAEKIQLELTEDVQTVVTEERQEVSYYKEARAADTTIKLISLLEETEGTSTPKHYLYAKISLKESAESLQTYRKLLEEVFAELKGTDISTSVWMKGEYSGYLTLERKNEITDRILKSMDATQVYAHREEDLYTVYAYTAALDSYITVEDRRINLHIALKQEEENYRTILYLASPIFPDTW